MVAVSHPILVNVYYLLVAKVTTGSGCAYSDERHRAAMPRRLVRHLEALGHAVQGYVVQLQLIA
jgi:hypothetical protein